jgi:hypothetical protein
MSLSKEVTKALKTAGFLLDINGQSPATSSSLASNDLEQTNGSDHDQAGTSGLQNKSKEDDFIVMTYKDHMKSLQFDSSEFSTAGLHAHHFSSPFAKAGMPSSQIIFRVAQELSSLSTSLPLDFSSAIFLRTDDDKPTLMKVLITG